MNEYNWQMYDEAGNTAVSEMMHQLKKSLYQQPLPKVRQQLHEQVKELSKLHGEVYDTDVRYIISFHLTNWACEVHDLKSVAGFNLDYWDF